MPRRAKAGVSYLPHLVEMNPMASHGALSSSELLHGLDSKLGISHPGKIDYQNILGNVYTAKELLGRPGTTAGPIALSVFREMSEMWNRQMSLEWEH